MVTVRKRKIGEALVINELKPSLNKQDKSFPLKLFKSSFVFELFLYITNLTFQLYNDILK